MRTILVGLGCLGRPRLVSDSTPSEGRVARDLISCSWCATACWRRAEPNPLVVAGSIRGAQRGAKTVFEQIAIALREPARDRDDAGRSVVRRPFAQRKRRIHRVLNGLDREGSALVCQRDEALDAQERVAVELRREREPCGERVPIAGVVGAYREAIDLRPVSARGERCGGIEPRGDRRARPAEQRVPVERAAVGDEHPGERIVFARGVRRRQALGARSQIELRQDGANSSTPRVALLALAADFDGFVLRGVESNPWAPFAIRRDMALPSED